MSVEVVPDTIAGWKCLELRVIESAEPLGTNGLYLIKGSLHCWDPTVTDDATSYEGNVAFGDGSQSPTLSLYLKVNAGLDKLPGVKRSLLSVINAPASCTVGFNVTTSGPFKRRTVNYLSFPDGTSVVLNKGKVTDYALPPSPAKA